jgi:hypothetical protein
MERLVAWYKRNAIVATLALVHASLVFLCWAGIATSDDTEAAMGWLLLRYIDWPISLFLTLEESPHLIGAFHFLAGGVQWLLIGILLNLGVKKLSIR